MGTNSQQPKTGRLKLGVTAKIRYDGTVILGVVSKVSSTVIHLAKAHEVLENGNHFSISRDDELLAFSRDSIEFLALYQQDHKRAFKP